MSVSSKASSKSPSFIDLRSHVVNRIVICNEESPQYFLITAMRELPEDFEGNGWHVSGYRMVQYGEIFVPATPQPQRIYDFAKNYVKVVCNTSPSDLFLNKDPKPGHTYPFYFKKLYTLPTPGDVFVADFGRTELGQYKKSVYVYVSKAEQQGGHYIGQVLDKKGKLGPKKHFSALSLVKQIDRAVWAYTDSSKKSICKLPPLPYASAEKEEPVTKMEVIPRDQLPLRILPPHNPIEQITSDLVKAIAHHKPDATLLKNIVERINAASLPEILVGIVYRFNYPQNEYGYMRVVRVEKIGEETLVEGIKLYRADENVHLYIEDPNRTTMRIDRRHIGSSVAVYVQPVNMNVYIIK